MSPDEYQDKYARYMASKVKKAGDEWSKAFSRLEKIKGQLESAQSVERELWRNMQEAEAANPDEVALEKEISEEHTRRLYEAKAKEAEQS